MADKKRTQVLNDLEVMDTLPEKEFNDMVELASAICNTPISLVSLLDNDRQWFKARVGLDATETPIEQAFCLHAIANHNEVLVVKNAKEDERFKHNPLVTGNPDIRFYAGAPLFAPDDTPIGTLCVIDQKPREFSDKEERALKILAEKTSELLALRAENMRQKRELAMADMELKDTLRRLKEAQEIADVGSWEWELRQNTFYWSDQMYELFDMKGLRRDELTFSLWQNRVHPEDIELVRDSLRRAMRNCETTYVEYRVIRVDKSEIWIQGVCIPILDEDGIPVRLSGTALNITHRKLAEKEKSIYVEGLEETLFDISHKIRRPVATCLGLIDVINNDDKSVTVENVKQMAKFFTDSVQEMDGFVKELTNEIHKKKESLKK